MIPSHPPIEFLNTLSTICKEWKKCGGFLSDFNDCTIQYLIDKESFSGEISRMALDDLSRTIFRLNGIIQHLYFHSDPIFNSLVALPGFSFGEDWFIQCDSLGFSDVYMPLMSVRYKGPFEEYFRELGRLRHSREIIERVVGYPSLCDYMVDLLESTDYFYDSQEMEVIKVYDFIFHVLFIVCLLNGFERLDVREYLKCHHHNGFLADLVSDYYHRVIEINGEVLPFSAQIENDSIVREMLEYEDDLSKLYGTIGEMTNKEAQAKKERALTKKKHYEDTLRICDRAFGNRIKVFSYCRSVYHFNEEIILYDSGTIVVYGTPHQLTDLMAVQPLSETSEELIFGEERITIECYKPENLIEFNGYLKEARTQFPS